MAQASTAQPAAPNRIRELRESLGLTQTQLGEKIGATLSQIARMETGDVTLINENLRRLEQVFELRYWQIMGDDKEATGEHYAALLEGMPTMDEAPLFVPDASHALSGADFGSQTHMRTARTNCLSDIGIRRGDILIVDGSRRALDELHSMQVVVATTAPDDRDDATFLRQFVEPDTLIGNSATEQVMPLHRKRDHISVVGVVRNRFSDV